MSTFRPLAAILILNPLWAQLPGLDGVPAESAFPAVWTER